MISEYNYLKNIVSLILLANLCQLGGLDLLQLELPRIHVAKVQLLLVDVVGAWGGGGDVAGNMWWRWWR